jgi:O-antigen/teichoic acid export membrane protein
LFGGRLVSLVYGPQYAEYGYLVALLAVRPLVMSLMIPTDSALFAVERPDTVFRSELWRAIPAVVPGLVLVYLYGVDGVAVTMVAMVVIGATYRFVAFWFSKAARTNPDG